MKINSPMCVTTMYCQHEPIKIKIHPLHSEQSTACAGHLFSDSDTRQHTASQLQVCLSSLSAPVSPAPPPVSLIPSWGTSLPFPFSLHSPGKGVRPEGPPGTEAQRTCDYVPISRGGRGLEPRAAGGTAGLSPLVHRSVAIKAPRGTELSDCTSHRRDSGNLPTLATQQQPSWAATCPREHSCSFSCKSVT